MFSTYCEHSTKNFVIGACIGSILGATAAVLFSKYGDKIQEAIVDKYHDIEDSMSDVKKTVEKKGAKVIAKAKHHLEDLVDSAEEK